MQIFIFEHNRFLNQIQVQDWTKPECFHRILFVFTRILFLQFKNFVIKTISVLES